MNRIALAAGTVPIPLSLTGSGSLDVALSAPRLPQQDTSVSYTTFAPIHYEARYSYPLIVWLHSTAGNERELRRVMPLVSMRNYVAVAPCGRSAEQRQGWRQAADQIEVAETRVADCVAAAQHRFNIHPNRIFLAGCGSGGTMALRIAWNDPQRFAGVVAINGPLPTRMHPLRRVNELRRVPCLLATSRDSREYPASRVCHDLRLLHAAGCTVALRQYPGSDELTSNMLSDMDRWLMELVCGG